MGERAVRIKVQNNTRYTIVFCNTILSVTLINN